jgi:hypothetical protein
MVGTINVYLEIGNKRTFAGAIDWPGWCRAGRDIGAALQALVDYGPRYAQVLRAAPLPFHAPADTSAFVVVEQFAGNATTDFGAPDSTPSADIQPLDDAALQRFQTLLQACWTTFDTVVGAAAGKTLRTGPRGGGRTLDGIMQHVLDADQAYLMRLARRAPQQKGEDLPAALDRTRQAILAALAAAARGELPEKGPRGGALWKPRSFVRRVAWHLLDHVWEIEDRLV